MTFELRTSVDIDATPERVWEVLTDLPAYALWNPFITRAEGRVAVGERLSFSLPPVHALLRVTLRPRVLEATPGRRLRLSSRQDRLGLPGLFDGEHTFTLSPHDGGVRLWQEQRLHGVLVPLTTRSLNRSRLPALDAMNAALKQRCEGAPAPARGDAA